MKSLKIAAIAITSFLFSCKEQLPIGLNLSNGVGSDSNYTLSQIPAAQEKHVLIEEFTGTTCTNCPKGSAQLKTIKNQYGSKLVIAKMYSHFLCDKVNANDPELKNDQAQEIALAFGDPPKPSALVDRLYDASNQRYYFQPNSWPTQIANKIATPTPINIDLSATLNSSTREVDLKMNFVVTQGVSDPLSYSIYVLEDGVIAGQDSSAGVVIPNYVHDEIMQQCITPTSIGSSFPPSFNTAVAGNGYMKKMKFTLNNKVLDLANTKLLVFVHKNNGTVRDVLHVAEIDL